MVSSLVLRGSSGCGKSTTLRIATGPEHADSGGLRIGGRGVSGLAGGHGPAAPPGRPVCGGA
ncbi:MULTISPECIES: ATP-binding cassette domain-containing protein [unclassified Streptomyces]|uniref:ATP-binding cassette domain-containing protein n=1 Tax=unclassified Streptomyces TaxID=2593676 RepID=UPI0036F0F1E7